MTWSSASALDAWERGYSNGGVRRALILLRTSPNDVGKNVNDASPGAWTEILLDEYENSFGNRIEAVTECERCGTRLELGFTTQDVRASIPEAKNRDDRHEFQLRLNDFTITGRGLRVDDLLAASACRDVADAHQELFSRSITWAKCGDRDLSVSELPEEVRLAVSRRLEESDPAGDLRLKLNCPDCRHEWDAGLDIGEHLWTELQAMAIHIQEEVVTLSRELGWNESDILAMSPWRRRMYLKLLGDLG